jgi:hypothetical protein
MLVQGRVLHRGDHIVLRRFGQDRIVRVACDTVVTGRSCYSVRARRVQVVSQPWLALRVARREERHGDASRWYNVVFLAYFMICLPRWLHVVAGKPHMWVFSGKEEAIEFIRSSQYSI